MSAGAITGPGASALAAQRKRERGAGTRLNLVSLMDIFTILVFFLMLNTGEVEVLQPDEKITLPKSFAELRPDNSPVVKVNQHAIVFKEQEVIRIDGIAMRSATIAPLYTALEDDLRKRNRTRAGDVKPEQAISIMGDASVDYALLKKVLNTCAQAGYRDVALAVEYSSRAAPGQSASNNAAGGGARS